MNKILVTGADGFIGSHLVESLAKQGNKILALCHYNSFNSRGWIDTVDNELMSHVDVMLGDIRDQNMVRNAMKGVDIVYHLAALIAIPFSYYAPESYVNTNVTGTLNILQAAKEFGTKRILVTSTSEVYGTARQIPIPESHPRQPQSPYSATKIAADALAQSYHLSFGLPVTIVRPFNTYGPRQSARAIIPTIISQLLQGQEKIRLGDLRPTRDLVFVSDTVEGFQRIAESDSLIGEDVNVSTEIEISISDLAQELIRQLNPKASVLYEEERMRPEKSEVYRLIGSSKKLFDHTGWRPSVSLSHGLELTVEWFKNPFNLSKYRSDTYVI